METGDATEECASNNRSLRKLRAAPDTRATGSHLLSGAAFLAIVDRPTRRRQDQPPPRNFSAVKPDQHYGKRDLFTQVAVKTATS